MDGRKNNRGTIGNKGGRPVGAGLPRGSRGIHQIRAYDDEWELIKEFQKLTRIDIDRCRLTLKVLTEEIRNYS